MGTCIQCILFVWDVFVLKLGLSTHVEITSTIEKYSWGNIEVVSSNTFKKLKEQVHAKKKSHTHAVVVAGNIKQI